MPTRSFPVFLAHGSQDPVVPPALGNQAREELVAAGFDVDWQTYPIPHGVSEAEIVDISNWMRRRMA